MCLLLVWGTGMAQQSEWSRVRIYCKSSQFSALLSLGIPAEGSVKKDAWVETDLSAGDIQRVRSAGFVTEILIEDVSFYYRDRNENPGKYQEEHPKSMDCDPGAEVVTPSHFVNGSMGGFYTYNELLAQLDSMRQNFPGIVSLRQQVGTQQSIEGRPLYYVKISDNPDLDETEPEVLYSALTHAREPMGMQALIFYMWYLLENYGTNAEITSLINNLEMYFVPCVNPDGYVYNAQTNPSGGGQWRKNRRNNGGSYGVDLNRNYGYMWGYDNTGSSPVAADETYRGSSAFSEPETQIMKWFCEDRDFASAIDYHCFGNYLIIPWCYETSPLTPDSVLYEATSGLMSASNGYLAGTVYQTLGYVANGGSVDWFYGEQSTKNKIMAWSPEAGDATDGFWPAANRIEDISKVNIEQNLYVARFAGRYAAVKDLHAKLLEQQAGYLPFSFQRLGMQNASFTVSLIPVSSNILSTGSPKVFTSPAMLQILSDSITYALQPWIQQGDEVIFIMRTDNGLYVTDDTLRKVYGTPTVVFSDACSNTTNWTAGGWGTSSSQYYSPPSSITDSPSGNYGNFQNKSITLSSTIDLSQKIYAQLNFMAKWDLENNYDYVQLKISTDGGTSWTALCGKYMNPGTADQILNAPLYDATQNTWVAEEIDLSDYTGSVIKLRFTLISDNYTTGDGFYFDDLEVLAIDQPVASFGEQYAESGFRVFPNPATDRIILEGKLPTPFRYRILDLRGRVITDGLSWRNEIDLNYNGSGIFMLEVESPEGPLRSLMIKN